MQQGSRRTCKINGRNVRRNEDSEKKLNKNEIRDDSSEGCCASPFLRSEFRLTTSLRQSVPCSVFRISGVKDGTKVARRVGLKNQRRPFFLIIHLLNISGRWTKTTVAPLYCDLRKFGGSLFWWRHRVIANRIFVCREAVLRFLPEAMLTGCSLGLRCGALFLLAGNLKTLRISPSRKEILGWDDLKILGKCEVMERTSSYESLTIHPWTYH